MIVTMTTGITLALTGSIMIATQTAQLIEILKSTDTSTRQQAEGVLEALGADAVEPLAQAMQSVDMGQAWRAARLLAKIDDPRRTLYMTRALASTNSLVGQVAVKVITTTLPADQCGACLVEHLRDCHPIVQVHMVTALATSHYYAAIDSLIALLSATESAEVRYTTIEGLGLLNATQAIELIHSFAHDSNHHVRERVKVALERLGAG